MVISSADGGDTFSVHDRVYQSRGPATREGDNRKRRLFAGAKLAGGASLGKDLGTAIVNGDFGSEATRLAALGAANSYRGERGAPVVPGEGEAEEQEQEAEEAEQQ